MAAAEPKQAGHSGTIAVTYPDQGIAVIHMKCGDNRINSQFIDKFNKALDEVEQHKEVAVLITTGEGKFYSNGRDLAWEKSLQDQKDRSLVAEAERKRARFHDRILTFPMPTIAAINGHAYAGGAVLSLRHNYRVMQEERGWWCMNEVNLGMPIPAEYRQLFPRQAVRDAFLFGRKFTAVEAKQIGIVDETCLGKDLLQTAMKIGRELIKENTKPYNREYLHSMKKELYKDMLIAQRSRL